MRESLLAEAASLALEIVVPDRAALVRAGLDHDVDAEGMAIATEEIAAGSPALAGKLVWNDKELIWEADWRLPHRGRTVGWRTRTVTFDAAFRAALRGAAQVLSSNGQPQ